MLQKLLGHINVVKVDELKNDVDSFDKSRISRDNACESTNSRRASFDEVREMSKRQIESFEHWARRLIDDFLRQDYGNDYLGKMVKNNPDQPLVKSEIKKRIQDRKKEKPGRYPRDIDAILLEDVEYFFTREDLYKDYYKLVFEPFYSGREEIRLLLGRLIKIRNKLYHDNAISIREAEQVLCYTNDFMDVFKDYYARQGKERDFNVPVILEFSDSQGNRSFRENSRYVWEVKNISREEKEKNYDFYSDAIVTCHRSGEHYEIELIIDNSFSQDAYTVFWKIDFYHKITISGEGTRIAIDFTDEMVSMVPKIEVKLVTNKKWHRFANFDCDDLVRIELNKILPPIEDSY